jgi:Amt family ammonium transporter
MPTQQANTWIGISAGMILLMVVPGLILFYGGLLRAASLPRLLTQAAIIGLLVAFLWWLFGYSFIFADGAGPIIGNIGQFAFLRSLNSTLNARYAFQGSQIVFCLYQLMFAIVTPLIIISPLAGRIRFPLLLVFVTLWMLLVYFPLAHMVWGVDGLMNGLGNPSAHIRALDFGGGMVVQMASGLSGLLLFLILGERFQPDNQPISQVRLALCLAGQAMLWIGWYGFNSGGKAAIDSAAQVFTTTTLATFVAASAWALADLPTPEKPPNLRFCGGAIAGLAAITPAAGYVTPTGAIIIGLSAGLIPIVTRVRSRNWTTYEQTIETFAAHALGGAIGLVLTGLLASEPPTNYAAPASGETAGLVSLLAAGGLWLEQLKAVLVTVALAGIVSVALAYGLKNFPHRNRALAETVV